jgi:hypothetical protein
MISGGLDHRFIMAATFPAQLPRCDPHPPGTPDLHDGRLHRGELEGRLWQWPADQPVPSLPLSLGPRAAGSTSPQILLRPALLNGWPGGRSRSRRWRRA